MDNEKIEAMAPCPFCQSSDVHVDDNGLGLIFHVRCRNCRSAGPGERCAADAETAWNRRAVLPIATAGMVPKATGDYADLIAMIRAGDTGQIDVAAVMESLTSTLAQTQRELAEAREAMANAKFYLPLQPYQAQELLMVELAKGEE